ncbi:MAG: DUF5687 family protein [Flavobacteriaceae bacterium]
MTSVFFSLGWKKFFRSAYWKKSLAANIFMGFLALYFIVVFLGLGISVYPILYKLNPEIDPFVQLNSFLAYWVLGDLVFRYFFQKIPILDVKSFLLLNISKSRIISYILNKSMLSFFNILPLFFIIPFCLISGFEGEIEGWRVAIWGLSIWSISLLNNFINFLAEKNNFFFGVVLAALLLFVINRYLGFYPLDALWGDLFMSFAFQPILVLIPLIAVAGLYKVSRNIVGQSLYLDEGLTESSAEIKTSDLDFMNSFGTVAPFLKNDIRLIWRNKRPRTLFLMSFVFVFYGLIFFSQDIYKDMSGVLIFASIFTTGGFAINFGQFIPAWDSKYYPMLMTQQTSYHDYLNSKFILMFVSVVVLLILATPYFLMGWQIYALIFVGALYNMGVNITFLLWAGAYIKKPIDLDGPAVGNMQGSSVNQFLMVIPMLGVPAGLGSLLEFLFSFEVAIGSIAVLGVLGILIKPYLLLKISKLYTKRKYQTLDAFKQ